MPPQLEQVVMKGLAKEPGQRFERIAAFANALEQALKPQTPIIVTPPTPPKPAIVTPPIGTTLVTYREHTSYVNAVAWAPDGIHIASGSSDYSVQIWDARIGSQKSRIKASVTLAVAWSPDGKCLAYDGGDDYKVHVWDIVQQREILQYTGHSDFIWALSWSPDGRYIVSGEGYAAGKAKTHDFTLHIWVATTGTRLSTYKGHSADVRAIQWSPDGRYIASGGNDIGVQVWEAATGRLVYTYTKHNMYVQAIAWSRDSHRLALGSNWMIQVWDALTGDNILSYDSNKESVATVAWSPDGRQIASGGGDEVVQIWDATTGKTIYTYMGHSDYVSALSWSPDSTRIASGSGDKMVQVWQAR